MTDSTFAGLRAERDLTTIDRERADNRRLRDENDQLREDAARHVLDGSERDELIRLRAKVQALADAAPVDPATELDELREKVAYLRSGCLNLTRDELVQKITGVAAAEWRAGDWLSERLHAEYRKGLNEGRGEALAPLRDAGDRPVRTLAQVRAAAHVADQAGRGGLGAEHEWDVDFLNALEIEVSP